MTVPRPVIRVFVSSTFEDLKEHRAAVIEAINRLADFKHVAMEGLGARDQESLAACLEMVRNSDVYIGMVGGRYGSELNGKSFTEHEYDEAERLNRVRLVFVPGDGFALPLNYRESDQKHHKLQAFRKKVEARVVGQFDTPNSLVIGVQQALLSDPHVQDLRRNLSIGDPAGAGGPSRHAAKVGPVPKAPPHPVFAEPGNLPDVAPVLDALAGVEWISGSNTPMFADIRNLGRTYREEFLPALEGALSRTPPGDVPTGCLDFYRQLERYEAAVNELHPGVFGKIVGSIAKLVGELQRQLAIEKATDLVVREDTEPYLRLSHLGRETERLLAKGGLVFVGIPESDRRETMLDLGNLRRWVNIGLSGEPLDLAGMNGIGRRLERRRTVSLHEVVMGLQCFFGSLAAHLPPFAVFRDAPFAPEMTVIPEGMFLMGTPDRASEEDRKLFLGHGGTGEEWVGLDEGDKDERPCRMVRIPRRFAVGRHPVTFDEYDRFVDATGGKRPKDHGWGRGRRPAIDVSWEDAQDYCAWLSGVTGCRYQLLSEAEWEYACRAGTRTNYWWGNRPPTDRDANFGNVGKTTEVGAYPPNSWGLCDMHGNVLEWVEDVWHEDYRNPPNDGRAWTTGGDSSVRVVRGGSWVSIPGGMRAADRGRFTTDDRYVDLGFRVSRTF